MSDAPHAHREMPRFLEVVQQGLGAAMLSSGDGGWRVTAQTGEVDVGWALGMLRIGENRLYASATEESEEVEAVIRREETHVVVANARCAVVVRAEAKANVGLALAYAHGLVREADR